MSTRGDDGLARLHDRLRALNDEGTLGFQTVAQLHATAQGYGYPTDRHALSTIITGTGLPSKAGVAAYVAATTRNDRVQIRSHLAHRRTVARRRERRWWRRPLIW